MSVCEPHNQLVTRPVIPHFLLTLGDERERENLGDLVGWEDQDGPQDRTDHKTEQSSPSPDPVYESD